MLGMWWVVVAMLTFCARLFTGRLCLFVHAEELLCFRSSLGPRSDFHDDDEW